MKDLATCIAAVQQALEDADRAAGTYADDPHGWHARHRFEMDRCKTDLTSRLGAYFNDRWDGCSVKVAGIRASCTSGVSGALRNWLNAARRKAEAGNG